jgi:hypothetical protein
MIDFVWKERRKERNIYMEDCGVVFNAVNVWLSRRLRCKGEGRTEPVGVSWRVGEEDWFVGLQKRRMRGESTS